MGGTLARVPYLSDIQHRRVIEPNGTEVAKLADLAVVPQGQFPAVQWAILATPEGERVVRWNELAQEIGHLLLRGRLVGHDSWIDVGHLTTDANGRWRTTGRAPASAQLQASFAGTAKLKPDASANLAL